MNLNQVTVPVKNVPLSIAFYELLGLKLIVHSHDNYARFLCANDATFSLHQTDDEFGSAAATIYFECADVDAEVKRLKQNGIVFTSEPTNQKWLWREASLKDLDGNNLIIYHAGKNRTDPPWRL
jgi:catechol 2,3-dioxygenase-like lactoylglutathione lyase family enzyme